QLRLEDLNARQKQRRQRLHQLISRSRQDKGWARIKAWLTPWRRKQRDDTPAGMEDEEEDEGEQKEALGEAHGADSRAAAGARPRVWVLDFHGDLKASGAKRLGEEVSALLDIAEAGDEVVLRLE